MGKKKGFVKTLVPLSKNDKLALYTGVKVKNAWDDATAELDVYEFGKLTLVLEAIYQQGKKDGARTVQQSFETMM